MLRAAMRSFITLAILIFCCFTQLLPAVQSAAAQSGADVEASISGPRHVRIGEYITYTITGTNIGDQTATGVQLFGPVFDWFAPGSFDCLTGTPEFFGVCHYPDLAPGESVSMIITLLAPATNKQEKHVFNIGLAFASNDVNPDNDQARIKLIRTGPCPKCPNK